MTNRFGWDGNRAQPVVLTVPGLNGSGPDHWQSRWEATRGDCHRVELGDWDNPRRELWVDRLDTAIRNTDGPIVIVAHSLGAVTVAWWAARHVQPWGWPVAGALLVAPADCDGATAHDSLGNFGPVPRDPLPFPSILVASRNDPYIRYDRAHSLGKYWGSHVVDAGEAGHINAQSDLGEWELGQALLDQLITLAQDQVASLRQFRPAVFSNHVRDASAPPPAQLR